MHLQLTTDEAVAQASRNWAATSPRTTGSTGTSLAHVRPALGRAGQAVPGAVPLIHRRLAPGLRRAGPGANRRQEPRRERSTNETMGADRSSGAGARASPGRRTVEASAMERCDLTVRPASREASPPLLDAESRDWLRTLRGSGRERDEAVARLHALLLRAARFEVRAAGRRCRTCAATTSTTSRTRRPTTRSCRSSRGSTTSAAPAASRPGRTSSPCSRRR